MTRLAARKTVTHEHDDASCLNGQGASVCLHMATTVKHVLGIATAALLLGGSPAFAQGTQVKPPEAVQDPETAPETPPDTGRPFKPDSLSEPKALPEVIPLDELQEFGLPEGTIDPETGELLTLTPKEEAAAPIDKPDYSRLPESEERAVRLDALFERLQAEDNSVSANLIAEEIWAIWLDSGSASVDMLLRRGTAAQKRGNDRLARRMYNHVIELSPDYAEGWARSARLALEEDDLSRALSEVTQALILEPRQFYAHWTLGNIFEKIGRTEDAYETYKEAARLYPELLPVKERLKMMKGSIEGDVL